MFYFGGEDVVVFRLFSRGRRFVNTADEFIVTNWQGNKNQKFI